jgi:hypothetical protein
LVQFSDFEPLPDGCVGHPGGLEWFCRDHALAAQSLSHLDTETALAELRLRYGAFPEPEPDSTLVRDPSLWVTEVGPNPARVLSVLQQSKGLTASQALAIVRSGTFEVACGWPQQFDYWRLKLLAAGASVEVRYD